MHPLQPRQRDPVVPSVVLLQNLKARFVSEPLGHSTATPHPPAPPRVLDILALRPQLKVRHTNARRVVALVPHYLPTQYPPVHRLVHGSVRPSRPPTPDPYAPVPLRCSGSHPDPALTNSHYPLHQVPNYLCSGHAISIYHSGDIVSAERSLGSTEPPSEGTREHPPPTRKPPTPRGYGVLLVPPQIRP